LIKFLDATIHQIDRSLTPLWLSLSSVRNENKFNIIVCGIAGYQTCRIAFDRLHSIRLWFLVEYISILSVGIDHP